MKSEKVQIGVIAKVQTEIVIICIERWVNWKYVSKVESTRLGDVMYRMQRF